MKIFSTLFNSLKLHREKSNKMTGSNPTNVLITGIGAGLVEVYLSRPSTTVVAGVRDPKHPTSQKLSSLPKDSSSKLIIVKIDNKSESDPADAIKSIQSQGVVKLDLVIANAGICNDFAPLATVEPAVFKEHVVVNGFAPLFLFQAVLPLLQKAEGAKFVGIGSPMGSIGGMDMRPFPMTAYGTSKAIFHWIVRKVHFEHPELISLIVDPGLVQTDMGNTGARLFGMKEAPVPTKDSVAGVVAQIDAATKENGSGTFAVSEVLEIRAEDTDTDVKCKDWATCKDEGEENWDKLIEKLTTDKPQEVTEFDDIFARDYIDEVTRDCILEDAAFREIFENLHLDCTLRRIGESVVSAAYVSPSQDLNLISDGAVMSHTA
ncbi:MAG: hypothetical protein Q9166_005086 [cf. Caloplaca sp. 2 TL-2023]